jgi:hypothetical protein
MNASGAANNAKITFGSGSTDTPVAGDIELQHDITNSGLTLNDDHRFQFRNNATYVASSASDILDLVAPTLNITSNNIDASRRLSVNDTIAIGGSLTTLTLMEMNNNDFIVKNITQDKNIVLSVNDGGSQSDALVIKGDDKSATLSGDVILKGQMLFNDSENEFSIAETGTDDYTIKNLIQDKDIIVNANVGGADTEIARFDGSASSLLMAGTNKVEFGAATDYINAANTKLNVRSNNPLWIDVSSIKMGNDLDTGSPDYGMVIEKDIDSETLTSSAASKPVWKLSIRMQLLHKLVQL